METIGQLCDHHGARISQGGTTPFYKTVVDPLLQQIKKISDIDGAYEVVSMPDVQAKTIFKSGDRQSSPLIIDYTGAAIGGRSLMIWIEPDELPESLRTAVSNHASGPLFVVPRSWTAKEFVQLIRF